MLNNRNKIFLIANADSIWTERYTEYVLSKLSNDITVISPKIEEREKFYKGKNIKVKTAQSNMKGHVGAIVSSAKIFKLLCCEKPDIIIVQFVHRHIAKLLYYLPFKTRIILTYIGSDLLRSSNERLQSVDKSIRKADEIVVMTKELKDRFLSVYGSEMSNKVDIIDMGDVAFAEIDLVRHQKQSQKNFLVGVEQSHKVIVTIGYNANMAQQQDKVLVALSGLPSEYKEKICIVLPMTYQRNDINYINRVEKLAESSGISYVVLSKFMNDKEIATLCVATDIFINAQITDALSNSMLEQLYAGSLVLNAEWLRYSFLEELDINFNAFSSIDFIPNEICKYIDDNQFIPKNENFLRLKEQCSWDGCLKKWELLMKK